MKSQDDRNKLADKIQIELDKLPDESAFGSNANDLEIATIEISGK
jgi:hypothetical protein